jgi:hypothetical protein
MGKIVVNKHFDVKSEITADIFLNKGEIAISNQVDDEGIFIVNKNKELICIGPSSWNSAVEDAKAYASAYTESALTQYVTKDYLDNAMEAPHVLLSSSEYKRLIEDGSVVVNGVTIVYDENTYYAIYEDVE